MARLILIPTPIGNLGDITLRALETIKSVDFILSEDTRVTGRLLKHFSIQKEMVAFHQHNEHKRLDGIVDRIARSESVGLMSDAGTPAISDPGFLLVRACIERGITIECLPGPVALIPALVQSGLPCDRFVFEGFLPHKKGRIKKLERLKEEDRTIVLYESPYRLIKLLQQILEVMGPDRHVSVSRELTKLFEETTRGRVEDVLSHFKEKKIKGEIAVVISGNGKS